jgi:ATP-binding cassette subfamily C protein
VTAEGAPGAARALFEDYRNFAGARLPLSLVLMIAGAVAEGFGILMIVPLVAFAMDGASLPPQLRPLLDLTSGLSRDQRFLLALAVFVAAMALRSVLLFARDMLTMRLQAGHEASMQLRAAATLAERGWPFAASIGQAGMQSLLLTDLNRAALAVSYGQQAVVALVMLLVQAALTVFLSPAMAAIALAMILLGYALSWRWVRRARRSGVELSSAYDESTAAGFRVHAGLKVALAQGTVPQFLREYRSSLSNVMNSWIAIARDSALLRALSTIASAVAASLLLLVGVWLLELPVALLLPLLVLFARMAGPVQSLQQSLQTAAAAAPAFKAVQDRIGPLPRSSDVVERRREPLAWGKLELREIRYLHSAENGISDVSLTLCTGEWVGVGGDSGAGKTTLLDIVAGLLPAQAGTIRIDGEPLEGALLDRWRDSLAYVAQGEMVFDDSVRGNLLADGQAAEDAELWAVLDAVGLKQRILGLTGGLDQQVGDRGSRLSGGERQRLALARALLRKPSLLILDEATAAMDASAELQVMKAMRSLHPSPAALVVAHRERTLAACDRRVSVTDGKLGEA